MTKPVFIQLYLPYSIKLFEQVSIKYSAFNYNTDPLVVSNLLFELIRMQAVELRGGREIKARFQYFLYAPNKWVRIIKEGLIFLKKTCNFDFISSRFLYLLSDNFALKVHVNECTVFIMIYCLN